MLRADPLSRRPDHEKGVSEDNFGQTMLRPEFFAIHAISTTHGSEFDDAKLIDKIKRALINDEMTKEYRSLLKLGKREFGKDLQE